uniref:SEA domain-containing protein n=1 Tax=Schistosoma mansoni TaxID=6183 RepID=A0A5K4F4V5_SCHMA
MTRTNLFTFDVPKIIFCIGLLCGSLLDKNLTAKTIHNYDTLTKPGISHRQKQLFNSIHVPEINFEVYGEFPTLKHFDLSEDEITPKYQKMPRFLQSREKRDLQSSEGNFLSDKYSILIKSRIHSPLKNWDDRLNDPQSKIYKLLSTSYCEFLLQSFQHANTSGLKQPECTFLEFTKGSIVLNAILTFNEANYSLLSPQDLSNLLIKGSKELIDSIVNDKTFSLGFNFNGDFSLRLNSSSDFMYTEQSLGSTLPYSEQVDETLDSTTYSVALNFTIKGSNSSLTWDDDLVNTTSTTYQELYRNVCELLLAVMRSILSSQWIVECGTIQFKKGSIDVDAELILTVNSSSINATSEPTSTILNDTNIITEINEYVSTVDQNDTFGIYIDPNSSISLSLIVISMESTISYDTQVIQDVTSSETNDEDSDPITMATNQLELTNESTVGENNSTDTSTLVIEQKQSTEMPYTPTLGETDSLITSMVSRISEETPDTTLLAQTFTDDMFLYFPLSVYSTSTG